MTESKFQLIQQTEDEVNVYADELQLAKREINSLVKGKRRDWFDMISQFLQNAGFEDASKAIDCKYEL